MDIVPDPPGTWNFNEVYLYEELMEADLHAIVGRWISERSRRLISCTTDSFRSAAVGRPLPVVLVSDIMWSEGEYFPSAGLGIESHLKTFATVHPLGQRTASGPQAWKSAGERGLRAQGKRFCFT